MLCYVIWRIWWSFSSKCLHRLPVYYADAVWIIVRECLSVWKSIHFSLENGGLICLYLVFYWMQTLSIPYGPLKSSQTIFFSVQIFCVHSTLGWIDIFSKHLTILLVFLRQMALSNGFLKLKYLAQTHRRSLFLV